MKVLHEKRVLEVPCVEARGLRRVFGLMFRGQESQNISFSFSKDTGLAIHSWFVFFPFCILWLDTKNRVQEMRIVKPFTTAIWSGRPYRRFIELPLNRRNKEIIKILVGEERFK